MAKGSVNYAEILPPLSTQEFENLKADIKANGQKVPISVDEEGNVLDGWHRKKILGNKVKSIVVPGLSEAEKKAFAFRSNRVRRNLSPAQEKDLEKKGKEIAFELRAEDAHSWTQAKVAAELGVARNTISDWFRGKTRKNVGPDIAAPPPDARVKVNPKHKPIIAERVAEGESTIEVAADYKVSQRTIQSIVNAETKKATAIEEQKAVLKNIKGDCGIIVGDFREIGETVADSSVSMIFTDPPYDKDSATLYSDLAVFANRVLVPGGWCLAYSGHSNLPEVYSGMSKHLTYGWTFAIVHSGGDTRFRKYMLRTGWKPIIGFYKAPLGAISWDWFRDIFSGGKEKDDHEWQQSLAEAEHFISSMSSKGSFVCDPFCGSGTSLLAAKKLGRKWLGIDIDEKAVETARIKISEK